MLILPSLRPHHIVQQRQGNPPAPPPSSLLLDDEFAGSVGTLLVNRLPSPVFVWGGYEQFGMTGVNWQLDGNGAAQQTHNPTGAQGTRQYHVATVAPSSEPLIKVTLRTPAAGAFRCGLILRRRDDNNLWKVRLRSSNSTLEIVRTSSGTDTVMQSVVLGALLADTEYTLEAESFGNRVLARLGATEIFVDDGSFVGEVGVGFTEAITSVDGHALFQRLTVEPSPSDTGVGPRLFYAPATFGPTTEFDSVAISGTGNSGHNTASGDNNFSATITATGIESPSSGVRFQWQGDEAGPVPTPKGAIFTKNIPDACYFTGYVYIPQLIERVGSFWLLMQAKQRRTDLSTSPIYSLNVGWTTDHMHLEVNSNMAVDGSYDGNAADLSPIHYTLPAAQWVRLDMLYEWSANTDGRLAFWMDNALLWDFTGIRTMFSLPALDWQPAQYPRHLSVAHYAAHLNPTTTTIYWDNVAVSVGTRLPDNYPLLAP